MVKCPRCGYENSSTAVYCDNCAYILTDANGNRINNSKRTSSWNIGFAKKVAIILGIIAISLLLFSFIYNITQPSQQESLNIISDDGSVHKTASYPYTAVVEYDGYWGAKMGNPNYLVTDEGSGTRSYILDCASWDSIYIAAQKYDNDGGELTVKLLRNGDVVAQNTTSNGTGSVSISYN